MERRQQVFVSSTYEDLVDERREVIQALLELRCLPAGMELFPATDEAQWSLIKRVIDESDYYLVIVGGRYGSRTDDDISYTEKEFNYAVEQKKFILAFVHSDPGSIPSKMVELDPESQKALDAFRVKVMNGRLVRKFRDSAELGSVVSRSLSNAIINHPGTGWVRGEFAITPETSTEVAELRERLAEAELNSLRIGAASARNIADLAHGDDEVDLSIQMDTQSLGEWTTYDIDVTWNYIFGAVGPGLVDETSETEMRTALENALTARVEDLPGFPEADNRKNYLELSGILYANEWEKVKIQLLALGFIERGTKRRPVSDKENYFGLTELGQHTLMQILAQHRPIKSQPSDRTAELSTELPAAEPEPGRPDE